MVPHKRFTEDLRCLQFALAQPPVGGGIGSAPPLCQRCCPGSSHSIVRVGKRSIGSTHNLCVTQRAVGGSLIGSSLSEPRASCASRALLLPWLQRRSSPELSPLLLSGSWEWSAMGTWPGPRRPGREPTAGGGRVSGEVWPSRHAAGSGLGQGEGTAEMCRPCPGLSRF